MTTETYKASLVPPEPQSLPQVFKAAAWLGWQIETNWATPFVFFIYSVIKPVSSAAILVIMYSIVTQGAFDAAIFPYIYVGNAFYIYVGAVMAGVSWAVIDDREHYKMLKYMYVAPIHIPTYLLGRAVAKFAFGTLSVLITLLFGVFFLNVPIELGAVNWLLLAVGLVLGVTMLAFLGLILGSITLIIANQVWFLGEAVAGALYIFSGAIFPLDVLPGWLQPVGYAMPLTYWLELMRRSLVGSVADAFPTLAQFSDLQLIGILSGMTIFFGLVAFLTFRYCDHRARELGYIDRVTNY